MAMFEVGDPEPTALVTGASSGIGEAFARKLARRGYRLVLVARREEKLNALADEIRDGREIEIEVLGADIASEEGLGRVLARIAEGDISLVVNNAGVGAYGDFADSDLQHQMEQVDVNVRALTAIAHSALAKMKEREHGTLINMSSSAAFQPGPHMATYAASKAYVLSLSEALHEEARPYGVTVTCVCPGPVKTDFHRNAQAKNAGEKVEEWPPFVYEPVDRIVSEALAAAMARRALVVPGVAQKVPLVGNRFIPRFASRRIAALVMSKAQGKTA